MLHLLSLLLPSAGIRSVDALTSLPTRRGLQAQIERSGPALLPRGQPISAALFDLDHFRRVNDILGRALGDAMLAGFAKCLREHCPAGHLAARWGGEEFLLLMPGTALADAVERTERVRHAVATRFLADGAPRITVSAGIAQAPSANTGHAFSLPVLIKHAEVRLHAAKASRNCVCGDDAARPPMPPMVVVQGHGASRPPPGTLQVRIDSAVTRR